MRCRAGHAPSNRGRRSRRSTPWDRSHRSRNGLNFERLEPRIVLDGGPMISEFMAANASVLADEDGDFSDWIEIYNPTDAAIDLDGWHLTDRDNNPTKWQFPAYTLAPDEYLVVFASAKDRDDPALPLHTNFKLSAGGEYLALVEPDGATVAFEFAPQYPQQFDDVAFGLGSSAEVSTLLTPGASVRALVPADDSLADTWTDPSFDDATWTGGTTGVGYETETGYEARIGHDVQAEMFGVNTSAYLRVPFDVDDLAAVDQLSLQMQYDDGFAAYLNGQEVARRNTPAQGGDSPPSGLISYWDFDGNLEDQASRHTNNSGTTEEDLSVQAGGNVRFVPGISGQAAALDELPGEALSLGAAESADTQLGPIYTIESWIYPTNLYSWGRFVLNWAGEGNSYHFALRNGNQVSLFHAQSNGSNRNADSASLVQLGSAGGWQHIAGIADGSRLRVYYNGVEVGSTTYNGTIRTVAQGLGIGDAPGGGYGPGFRYQGYLDELAIWNVALTDDQILSHYQAGPDGYGLTSLVGGSTLTWNSAAGEDRPDAEALQPESIDLSDHLDSLRAGTNVLAVHGLNSAADDPDFLIVPELQAAHLTPRADLRQFFAVPTPGLPNGTGADNLGPLIRDVPESLPPPADLEDIPITALAVETAAAIAAVDLHYRVMFGSETTVAMHDDGLHGDGLAGDGVFGAAIPAAASLPGQMVRWYVTAEDADGRASRWPPFANPVGSPEYFGTVVADPSIDTELPVFHRFIRSPGAAETGSGTRASVSYLDEFYDNVFIRIRGGTARSWPKKSYKLKFNEGHNFRFDPAQQRVDEININTTYTDKSYVRAILAYETHRDAGTPAAETFALRMQQNGSFFSVAHFVEQPQKALLRRHGLDDEGTLYKATPTNGLTGSATRAMDKKFPKDGDFSDLQALIDGLALRGTAQENFVFDNVNLPAQITFMAAGVIMQNIDATDKNYFIYRDTYGSGEWQMIPWDVDLTFGPNALNTDVIVSTDDRPTGHTSHPLLGGLQFPYHGRKNHLFDAIFVHDRTREMFVRRVRTLMDEFLNPADPHFENRIDELVALLGPDVALDKARWRGNAHFGNTDYTLQAANDRIKNQYLAPRRTHLFVNHNINNPGFPNNAGIPGAQPDLASLPPEQRNIEFGTIEYAPVSGNQDEEYLEIVNHNTFAVDISGWRLTEAVEFTFRPGTIIPAGDTLYVSPNVSAFRARAVGPAGGQGLFVQGNYDGHLSSFGETIRLLDAEGNEISTTTYVGNPSAAQKFLRISEIMYNPHEPTVAEIAAGFTDHDEFEYVELINTGVTPLTPVDLDAVHFSEGVTFAFSGVTLDPGERILVVQNQAAFQVRYGNRLNVAGEFTLGRLDNNGERLKLEDASNGTVAEFTYNDGGEWPGEADGTGASLEVLDTDGDYGDPQNWQYGTAYGGTPGTERQPRLGIVVNEVLSHTDPPTKDTIELHNTTATSIDVGGWYLSDDFGWDPTGIAGNYFLYKKFRIPDGTIIPDDGYLVFDEDDFNPTWNDPQQDSGLNDFALNGAHGDDVWLMKADAAGELTHFGDHFEFGAAPQGESFGRWPNGSGNPYPMLTPTIDEQYPENGRNSTPRIGPVIISEMHYNPNRVEDDGDLEFIEIYNNTAAPVDLTDWRLDGGIDFDFPAGTVLAAYSEMVILPFGLDNAEKWSAFCAEYGLDAGRTDGFLGGYRRQLSDGGELVQLQRAGEQPPDEPGFIPRLLEDEVHYDDETPWPLDADGLGDSLQRTETNAWGNSPQSWSALPPTPGTTSFGVPDAAQVMGRHVFYNDSVFDGNNPAAHATDDAAIGSDKKALLPGQTATIANYTSYSRGINGIMVDVAGLQQGAVPAADDFEFHVGNSNTPDTWAVAPMPSWITVRPGEGVDGSDRVTILWPDNAIAKQWLRVKVLATADTRLPETDIFYFGNAIGESGNSATDAKVNAIDMLGARSNQRNFLDPAPIDFRLDYDRDARVNVTDMLIARNHPTHFLNALRLIAVPGGKAAGEEASAVRRRAAQDAVFRQAVEREPERPRASSSKLDWLYEFDQMSTQKRSSKRDQSAEAATDEVLAMNLS